jgi:hypothetical protein
MELMVRREKWSDDRLDDFKESVDGGHARLEAKIDEGFARIDKDIRELRGEMASTRRVIYTSTVVIVAALIGPILF